MWSWFDCFSLPTSEHLHTSKQAQRRSGVISGASSSELTAEHGRTPALRLPDSRPFPDSTQRSPLCSSRELLGFDTGSVRATWSLNSEVFIFCSSWLRLADRTKVSLGAYNPSVTVLCPSVDAMQLTSHCSTRCRAFIPFSALQTFRPTQTPLRPLAPT